MSNLSRKTIFIVLLELGLACISIFRLGQVFSGQWYTLYYGYFGDIQIPFSAYFLLSLNEESVPYLRPWYRKWGLVFLVMTTSEISQYFGFPLFGVTFDVFDILAYGVGVSLAALVDVKLFAPYLKFWKPADITETGVLPS